MQRKVHEDKDGVFVKHKNKKYRPDTLLEKDTEHTRQVRTYLAQINESRGNEEVRDHPTKAIPDTKVEVEDSAPASERGIVVRLPEVAENADGQEETVHVLEIWYPEDLPELTDEQKQSIKETAVAAKKEATKDGAQGMESMDFLKTLMEKQEPNAD